MKIQNKADFMVIGTLDFDYKKSVIERAKERNFRYVIVVCDTFSWEDYAVIVGDNELEARAQYYMNANMQKIMGIYDISI